MEKELQLAKEMLKLRLNIVRISEDPNNTGHNYAFNDAFHMNYAGVKKDLAQAMEVLTMTKEWLTG